MSPPSLLRIRATDWRTCANRFRALVKTNKCLEKTNIHQRTNENLSQMSFVFFSWSFDLRILTSISKLRFSPSSIWTAQIRPFLLSFCCLVCCLTSIAFVRSFVEFFISRRLKKRNNLDVAIVFFSGINWKTPSTIRMNETSHLQVEKARWISFSFEQKEKQNKTREEKRKQVFIDRM